MNEAVASPLHNSPSISCAARIGRQAGQPSRQQFWKGERPSTVTTARGEHMNKKEQEAIIAWQATLKRVSTCFANKDVSHHYECIDALIELIYLMRKFYTGKK